MYAPARFALDFLRASDVARPDQRYLGLTPAQWACLATAALGVYLWRRGQTRPPDPTAPSTRQPMRPLPAERPRARSCKVSAFRVCARLLAHRPKSPEPSGHDTDQEHGGDGCFVGGPGVDR